MTQREDLDQGESSKDRSSLYGQWFAQQRTDGVGGGLSPSLSSQMSGFRLRQLLVSALRGMLGASQNNQNAMFHNNDVGGATPVPGASSFKTRVGILLGGKYSNVLARFYPAVSAHHVQADGWTRWTGRASLGSHSGLTGHEMFRGGGHEMFRGGRCYKGIPLVRSSRDSTVHTLPPAKKTFKPDTFRLFSTLDAETATSSVETGVEMTIHKDKEKLMIRVCRKINV